MAKKTAKRVKHVPQRTCVGCRQILAKRSLIRIARTPEGLRVDPTGKLPGRGAYLHDARACWERGIQGALTHALKVELTDQDRNTLRAFMDSLPEETLAEGAPDTVDNPDAVPAENPPAAPGEPARTAGGQTGPKTDREENVGKRIMTR